MGSEPSDRRRSTALPVSDEANDRAVTIGTGWQLSQHGLERFLAALHPDRNMAAERYEQIRAKLLRFFEWRGCAFPEEHADDTITRVIRKIDEGDRIEDPARYCHGVARLVLLEALKQRHREREAAANFRPASPAADESDIEQRLDCLRACMNALPSEQRALIAEYYGHDNSERIARRKRLADVLGIGLNALRIRAHRLSDRLATCVRLRLAQHMGS